MIIIGYSVNCDYSHDYSFQTTKNGERTVFVGQVKTGVLPEFEHIFVAQQQTDKNLTVIAQSAKMQESADGRSFLILENGRQYLLEQEKEQVSSMRFGRYGLSLEDLIVRMVVSL